MAALDDESGDDTTAETLVAIARPSSPSASEKERRATFLLSSVAILHKDPETAISIVDASGSDRWPDFSFTF